MMRLWVVGCLFALGCNDASEKVEQFANRACECKDAACGKKVLDDFASWAESNADAKGDQDRATREAKRMFECVVKSGVEPADLMTSVKRLEKLK